MKRVLILLLSAFFLHSSFAQTFDDPVKYMDHIARANEALTLKYLSYMSAVSHGKSAKKVEKKRQEVLNAIVDTRFNIMSMAPYKGDRTLKDTTVAYLKMLNSVFNEDYGKIVNMEEIAEQSYDAMEAYLLAQEKANQKLEEASERQRLVQNAFAAKNNITLVEGKETATSLKMKTVNEVMEHYNEVYLIFFKVNKQEAYLMDAVARKDVNGIEQNLNSMTRFADEGKEKLKGLKGYKGDGSLISACEAALDFYKMEAEKSTAMSDYYLKAENFAKVKKQFDAKPSSKRTQQDVDQFNKAVNEINDAGNVFNKLGAEMDKQRNTAINGWNKSVDKFMDTHMPTQR